MDHALLCPLNNDASILSLLLIAIPMVFLASMSCDRLVLLNVNLWPGELRCELVACDDDARLGLKESVDVFKGPVCRFRVEKVCDWYEQGADDRPDNPEAESEVLNTG